MRRRKDRRLRPSEAAARARDAEQRERARAESSPDHSQRGERPPLWATGAALRVDWHRSTMAHLRSVYPFHADSGFGDRGPYLGVSVSGGMGAFHFDPFELYGPVLTNPNVMVIGEVGSGKTIVALRAMLQVVDSGGQAALLAPTDVLAQQHLRSMSTMLGDLAAAGMLGGAEVSTRLTLLTGSLGAKARRQALLDAASGEAGIVIGTHALLEEHVSFADLGLVVVDEQHRFGVEQRAALGVKADKPPHVLVMTATPIPRTVAMTVFGDLDTSTLSQLPAGRAEVQTNVVPLRTQPGWLPRVWERIREEVATGRQAYVVCSRIDSTDDETDGLWGVVELAEELGEDQLKGLRVEVLHGRLPAETKDAVMLAFAAGEIDVLVSTTVIEVGVDVPNASVMAIMDADRFGVSQLHQLRGRIGRGGHAGVCLLVTRAEPGTTTMQRLEAVASTRDGFALSRIDLEQRREGDVLGTAQSGGAKSLKKLSVLNDEDIIVAAREAATSYVRTDATLAGLPDLADAVAKLEASQRADFMEMG